LAVAESHTAQGSARPVRLQQTLTDCGNVRPVTIDAASQARELTALLGLRDTVAERYAPPAESGHLVEIIGRRAALNSLVSLAKHLAHLPERCRHRGSTPHRTGEQLRGNGQQLRGKR
jgi:hypothetical protein